MQEDLRKRTKQFALRIIKLYLAVPQKGVGYVLGPQLLKAGTSVGLIIARPAGQNQMLTSSVKLKEPCKSWMKRRTGLSYFPMEAS